jgi:hypothetical protein
MLLLCFSACACSICHCSKPECHAQHAGCMTEVIPTTFESLATISEERLFYKAFTLN